MPASMALASEAGMAATARPNGLMSPAATMRTPTTRKAPTAAGKPPLTAPVAASSAAPGVDHAEEIGMRNHRLSTTPASPMAIASAIRPEAACASFAPAASRPRSTTAKELAKPTKAVTRPAATGAKFAERDIGIQALLRKIRRQSSPQTPRRVARVTFS